MKSTEGDALLAIELPLLPPRRFLDPEVGKELARSVRAEIREAFRGKLGGGARAGEKVEDSVTVLNVPCV